MEPDKASVQESEWRTYPNYSFADANLYFGAVLNSAFAERLGIALSGKRRSRHLLRLWRKHGMFNPPLV